LYNAERSGGETVRLLVLLYAYSNSWHSGRLLFIVYQLAFSETHI
jgi:hypothetical protein